MRIAICDDEKIFLTDVKERLSAMGLSCDCYDHEARLLDAFLQDSACYHLVILDMQLSEQEGIAVAKKIRSMNAKVMIIFLTAFEQYAIEAFECSPLRYLKKPIQENKFKEAIETARQLYHMENGYVTVSVDGVLSKIKNRDIVYIEGTRAHRIKIYTAWQKEALLVPNTLKEIQKQLDNRLFFRVQNSFIVNLHYITGMQADCVLLGEHKIPVARAYKQAVLNYYLKGEMIE